MKFRPCIDIHNGKVKQIVGGTLSDEKGSAEENFVSGMSAGEYAKMFKKDGLTGGHVVMLNAPGSPSRRETEREAFRALSAFPGGLQIGGGITDENALEFIDAGASHVIVTSFAFSDGVINFNRLKDLRRAVGRDRVVLDLSCRKSDGRYKIVTDRWQVISKEEVSRVLFEILLEYCDEFLIHGVDMEGEKSGPDFELVELLSDCAAVLGDGPARITYAGGITDMDQIKRMERISSGKIDYTVGSALDIYGGTLRYADLTGRRGIEQRELKL